MKLALLSLLILASASAAEEPSKGVLTNLVEGIASALDLEYAQPGSRAGGAAPTKVKIVLGGLARTGMTSVQQALTQLNFTGVPGMPDLLDAVGDEIDALYSTGSIDAEGFIGAMGRRGYEVCGLNMGGKLNAAAARLGLKVILPRAHDTAEEWATSMQATIAQQYDRGRERPFTWLLPGLGAFASELKAAINDGDGAKTSELDLRVMARNYAEHNERVRKLVPAANLLDFDVREGWPPLCAFVGVAKGACPTTPFPKMGTRAEIKPVIFVFWLLTCIWPALPLLPLLMIYLIWAACRCCCVRRPAVAAGKKKKSR